MAIDYFTMVTASTNLWVPPQSLINKSYVKKLMRLLNAEDASTLRRRSVENIGHFWDLVMEDLKIEWFKKYSRVIDKSRGIEWTRWFLDGEINIVQNCIDRHLPHLSDKTAILWEGDDGSIRSLTYAQFSDLVGKCANALLGLGVGPGDCVGILMPMVPEVVVSLFACFKIGAIAIPIFSGFGSEAIATRLRDANAKILLTSDISFRRGKHINVKKTADEACLSVPTIKARIVLRRGGSDHSWDPHKDCDWEGYVGSQSSQCKTIPLESESASLILFTSGTTGNPKGTIHTHAGCLAQIGKEHRYAFNVDEQSRFFWYTDIGWMMGPWEMIGVTLFGGTVFLYEGAPDFPTPSRLWDMIDRHRLTVLGISPTAIRLLMTYGENSARAFPMQTLQLLGSTGEPWDEHSYKWFFTNVGKQRCPIINISGGTEIIGCLLSPLPIENLKPCSLGGPGLGVDADVFDEQGLPVRNGIGHLVCKQALPSMTKGFLNSKDRYLQTYFSKWKGVWYHGDWAHIDEDGQWFLHGRSDDTIKIAGKRVGPVEYEAALMQNPCVAEAAAIAIPDPIKGENCVCFVVLKSGILASEDLRTQLQQCVVKTLGKSLAPKEVRFTQMLPKTRSAKILRGLIKQIYLKEKLKDTTSVENIDSVRSIMDSK